MLRLYVISALIIVILLLGTAILSCNATPVPPGDLNSTEIESIDTDPPQIKEIFPEDGATGVPTDTEIRFRLEDSLSGVVTSSIIMKVKDKPVEPIITGDKNDTLVTYQPEEVFSYGETVIVNVSIEDYAPIPNDIEYTFSFLVEHDKNKPYIAGLSPHDGSTDVPVDTKINFHLVDNETGVDQSSVVLKINDIPVKPVFSGDFRDYLVEYQPREAFLPGEIVNVDITALDLAAAPNRMEYSYSFTAGSERNIRLDIIYYGKHTPEVDSLIISVAPRYLIGNTAHGLWGEVYGSETWWLLREVNQFQEAGVKVIGYLTSGYEGAGSGSGIELKWYTLEMNKKLIINMAEKDGVDGIFIDECSSFPDAESKRYLKELTDLADSYGLIIWGNVGHDSFDEWFFTDGGFDMMNASENWHGQTLTPVQEKWGRFISVSGFYSGHDVTGVYNLVKDAWEKGLAYAYITGDAYARLPSWIELLAELIRTDKQ